MTKKILEIENIAASEIFVRLEAMTAEMQGIKAALQQPTTPTTAQHENMTINEVCDFLRMDRVTLWKWTKQGKLIAYRIGSKKYYKRIEVQTVLNNAKTV